MYSTFTRGPVEGQDVLRIRILMYPKHLAGPGSDCTTHQLKFMMWWGELWSVLRIRDVYPGFWFLPIPDPKTVTKKRGEQKLDVKPLFNKIVNYFSFEVLKKKIWKIFKEL